jgi:hypothetical protein
VGSLGRRLGGGSSIRQFAKYGARMGSDYGWATCREWLARGKQFKELRLRLRSGLRQRGAHS